MQRSRIKWRRESGVEQSKLQQISSGMDWSRVEESSRATYIEVEPNRVAWDNVESSRVE